MTTKPNVADELERRAEPEFGAGDGVFFNGLQYVPMKHFRDAIAALRAEPADKGREEILEKYGFEAFAKQNGLRMPERYDDAIVAGMAWTACEEFCRQMSLASGRTECVVKGEGREPDCPLTPTKLVMDAYADERISQLNPAGYNADDIEFIWQRVKRNNPVPPGITTGLIQDLIRHGWMVGLHEALNAAHPPERQDDDVDAPITQEEFARLLNERTRMIGATARQRDDALAELAALRAEPADSEKPSD